MIVYGPTIQSLLVCKYKKFKTSSIMQSTRLNINLMPKQLIIKRKKKLAYSVDEIFATSQSIFKNCTI